MANFYAYIVECADGTFYVGKTNNLEKRIRQHNISKKGAKYTRHRRPVTLRYFETFTSHLLACRREIELKKLTHFQKQKLCQ